MSSCTISNGIPGPVMRAVVSRSAARRGSSESELMTPVLAREPDGELTQRHRDGLLGCGDDVRRRTDDLDVGEATGDLAHHGADLVAGEVRPEAEVRAPAAERDLRIVLARDVELVGTLERARVAVGCGEPHA